MNRTHLNLETVTPIFLRGADNRTPELRPPPFKALFRYWWRAAVGETNIDTLRGTEGRLFGNTKGKSPLSIRISRGVPLPSDKYPPLPHDPGRFTSQAYSPNQKFNLTLAAPVLNEYKKIAILSFLLGGVGNRSRRGFGSIRYQDWAFQTVKKLKEKVYQTLNEIVPDRFRSGYHNIEVDPWIGLPDYPIIRWIYFGNSLYTNVNDLLVKIGQATRDHNNDALGYAKSGKRLASPIHVRIQKLRNEYVPIVTQLHWNYPGYTSTDLTRQQGFIDQIIGESHEQ